MDSFVTKSYIHLIFESKGLSEISRVYFNDLNPGIGFGFSDSLCLSVAIYPMNGVISESPQKTLRRKL